MHYTNALLDCLVIFTKLYHKPFSAEALTSGLPVDDESNTPELFSVKKSSSNFSRASARAGLSSRLVKRKLIDIPDMVLPCILVLEHKNACILESIDRETNTATIILKELPDAVETMTLDQLDEVYLGYAFYIKKEHNYEESSLLQHKKENKHWFWHTLLYSKSIYRDVLIASFVINLFVLAAPLFTMNVYDRVVPNSAIETMWVLAIGVVVIYFLDMVLKFLRTYYLEIAGKKSDIIMSSILFEKVLNLKMSERPNSVGSFASNLKEFDSIRSFFTSSTLSSLIDLPFTIIFLSVTYYIAGFIIIVPIVIMSIILLYTLSVRKPLQRSIESTYAASAYKNAVLIESLGNLETIKLLGSSGHAQYKWEEATGDIATKSLKSKLISNSITTLTSFFIQLNTVAVLLIGVYLIDENLLSMGGLIASVILTSRAITPIGQVASLLSSYEQTHTALNSLNEIMKLPVERPEGKRFINHKEIKGKIEFKNVSFTYPNESKKSLDNVSFTINEGEKVAIIGKMGSGKSTIQKLMINLYQATEGSILLDDIEITQIDPADLRKQTAFVPQDSTLFNATLRENIVYKNPNADDKTILKAASIGTVDQFVNLHPHGFDMQIGEGGYGLSGGQKQSVNVARAFTQESPLVILDEPSNAMDNSTESILLKRLKLATHDKTVILVTHKTSMLDLVDRVIIIDQGKVIIDGEKELVMKKLQAGANSA